VVLSGLSVFQSKSLLYGIFVWACRALNSSKRRFPTRAGQGFVNLIDNSDVSGGNIIVPGSHLWFERNAREHWSEEKGLELPRELLARGAWYGGRFGHSAISSAAILSGFRENIQKRAGNR